MRLRRGVRGVVGQAAELVDQLGIGIEIGQHDHLADVGVAVAAAADSGEAAPPAAAAAATEADVRLARIALDQRFLVDVVYTPQNQ